jgi:heavy metal sensor kinase
MKALSIRLRLTLLYFAFFSAAGLLLSVTSWLLLQRSLDALMLHELDEREDDIEALLALHGSASSIQEIRNQLLLEYRLKDEGKWLQVSDGSGHWLYYSSRSRIGSPISAPPNDTGLLTPFIAAPGHSLRTLYRAAQHNDRRYLILMAISADMSTKILARFRSDLLLMVPVVLLAAAGMGHFLGRRALAPVRAIVTEVREIHDRNLSRRLPVSRARDELSELSSTLNAMFERIDVAFRSVRSLTANASHELRTPLSLIRTRVEIALCFPRSSEQYRSALQEVQVETVRMTDLIENLLVLARLDAGVAQPELQPVDLSALIRNAAQEWKFTAEASGLDLKLQDTGSPLQVLGNPDGLERLLRMLIDNACRYTKAGGVVCLGVERNAGEAMLWVSDTGIGISDEELPHIFDRFYRGRRSQALQRAGSGLGLSLAKWIADQHRGTITVASVPGDGSCFKVAFPEYRTTEES